MYDTVTAILAIRSTSEPCLSSPVLQIQPARGQRLWQDNGSQLRGGAAATQRGLGQGAGRGARVTALRDAGAHHRLHATGTASLRPSNSKPPTNL